MLSQAHRRLLVDLNKLRKEDSQDFCAQPTDNDIMKWDAWIFGPEQTAWEGGSFQLLLSFSNDYPAGPPEVKFIGTMFHPNVYADGRICLDVLKEQWTPIYDVWAILTTIRSLLCDPNPNSPANPFAAKLYQTDRSEYERKVRELVEQSLQDD